MTPRAINVQIPVFNPAQGKPGMITAVALVMLTLMVNANATNGYFTHGVGVKNKALAGAGSAMPAEAVATAINPAAAVVVGNRFEVGLAVFFPVRSYKTGASAANGNGGAFTIGPNDIESDNKSFPIPFVSRIWERGEHEAIALSFYARGGMNTRYQGGTATFDPDGPGPVPSSTFAGTFGDGTTGIDLSQVFFDLTYARRIGTLNWGVSMVLAGQSFAAKGLARFAGFTETFARSGGAEPPRQLTDNGHDLSFGYGFKTGVIWNVNNRLNLAVAYQSRTTMQKFDRYADLFAQNGSFDIPASARAGVSWVANDRLTLHFDVERTWFGEVDAVGNPIANLVDCPTAGFGGQDFEACLGGDKGIGFGWDNITVFRLGAQVYLPILPNWTWRAGFSKAKQPIDEPLFNILAPAVVEQHYTFGASRILNNGHELSFSMMYAPNNTVHGTNAFDPSQNIELKMHQFEFELGFSF